MASIGEEQKGRWSVYFVTVSLGVAFSITLLSITWNNALDKNKKDFALESIALKESISRNVRTAHDLTNNFTAFFKASPELDEQQFNIFTETLLQQHDFIHGAIYYPSINIDDSGSGSQVSPFFFRVMREDRPSGDMIELHSGAFREAINTALASREVLTMGEEGDEQNGKKYWMFKALDPDDMRVTGEDGTFTRGKGLVALLVDTTRLFADGVANTELALTMFSNASSLSARELLYRREAAAESASAWRVATLEEEGLTQFPSYSIKLTVKKQLGWEEVDKELVFNALLIGVGITLLIVALVRAKDQQARELKERNIVIEKQVKEQTRELAETRDKALEASRVKSEFLASMSHEIRTPLNAIIGMSSLLEETPLNSEQKNYINVFKKAGDTLLSLVNDILDLSKIEAKQLVLENIEFDLRETVEESVEIYALKAAGNNIELLCYVDEDINTWRMGDPARLRQIILNLISNALKFTERGEVVVRVESDPDSQDGQVLRFSVTDTGIGIPAQKLEAIFASFTQVDSSTTRKYGGTGLGLTISKSLSEMMGGRIWVESEEGKGSTFCFTANLEEAQAGKKEGTGRVNLEGNRVLVVDDNSACSDVLKKILVANAATVKETNDTVSALRLITDKDGFAPSIILVDYKMPGIDGFDFVKEIKSSGNNSRIVLLLGAADLNSNMPRIKESGIDAYLVKPVKRADLLNQLGTMGEGVKTGKGKTQSATLDKAEKPLRILLVEDNPDNRLLIKAYLKKLPYDIDEAENGQIAVDKFRESAYDIVLMDVQMPIMDGHQATQSIRSWEKDNNAPETPIISLTAHAFKEEVDKCLAAGCNTHLSKPVKKATLIATIQEYTALESA